MTALNGVAVTDLWQRFRELASYESGQAAVADFPARVRFESWLRLLGAEASEGVTVTLDSGAQRLLPVGGPPGRDHRPPEVRFENGLGVLVLHDCTPGAEYTEALDTFFTGVRERGLTKIVVDLRDNPGGNSGVAQEFMARLPVTRYHDGATLQRWGPWVFAWPAMDYPITPVAEPYGGKVYVLTSAATFSSAVIFTYLLQDNHLATVVGQSPSNNPNSYGDVIPLRLPNSRLRWIMTYKYFERANGDNDPATPLAPTSSPRRVRNWTRAPRIPDPPCCGWGSRRGRWSAPNVSPNRNTGAT